jgi:hypothetical protein
VRKTPLLRLRVSSAAALLSALVLLPVSCKSPATVQHPSGSDAAPAPAGVQAPDRSPASDSEPSAAIHGGSAPKPSSGANGNRSPEAARPEEQALAAHRPASGAAIPPAVRSAASPGDDELIEQSLAKLRKGNLTYSTPLRIRTGNTAHIVARIATDKITVQALQSGMPAGPGTQTEIEATPISTKMKMTLAGADFEITPLSSEEQIVGGDLPTQWEWDVIPRHAGTLRLHLAATVELKDLSRDFTSVDRDIAVQVDPIGAVVDFAEKNVLWIFGSLGTGFTGLWAWWRRRKKSREPSGQTH